MKKVKAVVVTRFGGPDVLELREIPAPEPGPGEVTVSADYAGVGFVDTLLRSGHFDLLTPPFIPGIEVAGEWFPFQPVSIWPTPHLHPELVRNALSEVFTLRDAGELDGPPPDVVRIEQAPGTHSLGGARRSGQGRPGSVNNVAHRRVRAVDAGMTTERATRLT